jgi:hypothetical protein
MKVYIIAKRSTVMVGCEGLEIMKVADEMEAAFLEEYAGRILIAGASVQEVVIKFSMASSDQHQ